VFCSWFNKLTTNGKLGYARSLLNLIGIMMNNQSKNNSVSDELLYEFVMDEMEQESELIKGLWAKALAHSEGSDSKAKSLYMQYRVQAIKDQLSALQIDLGDLSKEELFESIKNGFTIIPEKIQMIKEQKAVAEEKAIEVAIEEETKKEHEKYGKIGGWLIVLAVFLVLGNLFSFIYVERYFENESLDTLKLLYQNGLDGKASILKTIAYISFVSYGLLLTFTISFFRKDILTKNFAIIYFASNIVAFPIVTYLLMQIDLPTMSVMSGVIGGIFQVLFSLIWIRYFMVSERVKKTFVNGTDENDISIVITLLIGLGATVLASILYANQSDKNTLMAGQTTVTTVQTTSEVTDAEAPAPDAAMPADAPAADAVLPANSYTPPPHLDAVEAAAPAADTAVPASRPMTAEEACNNGDSDKCGQVGIMYHEGQGVDQSYSKAMKFLKKACDGGNINGCKNLGIMYATGEGVEEDSIKAVKILKKACDGGSASGCAALGNVYKWGGNNLEKDMTKAAIFLKKACDAGSADGCSDYEKLQNQGY
jgi:hypothetical protein